MSSSQHKLETPKELQRAVFEALASKSKLSKQDAFKLADKVSTSMSKEIKKELA
tara:strand:+ start:1731 stop:1892 length:162 start_codon:yes stop_codon:yes gene_type:complete